MDHHDNQLLNNNNIDAPVVVNILDNSMTETEILSIQEQAARFWKNYQEMGNISDLDITITLEREVISLILEDSNKKQESLSNLSLSLLTRFEHSDKIEDLEEAIALQQQALDVTPDNHANKPTYLNNLGISFESRFGRFGKVRDIDQAIHLKQQAVDLTPDGHANKPNYLNSLGISFESRFGRFGQVTDIDQAIQVNQQVVNLTPDGHADKPMYLNNLGNSFESRFERFGEVADIDQAIQLKQQAVDFTPNGHANKPMYLNNLGSSLESLFGRFGQVTDIDQAIQANQQAVDLTPDGHADKPMYLSNLGISFESRFRRFGQVTDIDQAIQVKQQAVNLTPDGHSKKPIYLNNLGNSLESRFGRFGEVADIDQAIRSNQQAVDLTPDGHANKPGRLNNLGISFESRFGRFGQVTDIDQAIHMKQQAVDLTPDDHSSKPGRLNNLGSSFQSRFERFGEVTDIDQAIQLKQQAVDFTPDGHADKPMYLNNLGNSFESRFRRFGQVTDIDQAIQVNQRAVDLTPDGHAEKPMYLSNLGISLESRFGQFGQVTDIDQAIHVKQQAVNLTPDGHAKKPMYLNNLGNSFQSRFGRFSQVTDIDQAINVKQQAVDFTPDGHVDKPMYLNNLGHSFTAQFNRTSNAYYLHHAISAYSTSASSLTGSPRISLEAARCWALIALNPLIPQFDPHLSFLEAGRMAMELIPRVVWLGNSTDLRYQDISSIGNSVNIAASVACYSSRPDLALEWLEQGRSIVWGQMLGLRTPLDDLQRDHAELANLLKDVSYSLEIIGNGIDIAFPSTINTQSKDRETMAQEHRRLAKKWESLIVKVRQCSGYEDFLQPPKLSSLAHAAVLGPIAVINVESHRCDAIILQNINGSPSAHLEHIHLQSASLDKITKAHRIFIRALTGRGARCPTSDLPNRDILDNKVLTDTEEEQLLLDFVSALDDNRASAPTVLLRPDWMSRVFQMLWTDIVAPIFQALGYTSSSFNRKLPHITWCTTGPLSFLPLHAAGYYTHDGSMSHLRTYKYAVSSYTPSLSALLKHKRSIDLHDFRGLAVVSQPSTPGQSPIPFTEDEATKIQAQFDIESFTWLNDAAASQETVLDQMRKRSWIHLACHGVQKEGSPMDSAFMLHDGPLDLRTISRERLLNARLAFLSACQTAKGDEDMPDEAAHLAAGMLMSGYHTVIGTMWSIRDQDGPIVAEEFYKYLKTHGMKTNDGEAAYALHEAVGRLRDEVGEEKFLAWVPFIHLGI